MKIEQLHTQAATILNEIAEGTVDYDAINKLKADLKNLSLDSHEDERQMIALIIHAISSYAFDVRTA